MIIDQTSKKLSSELTSVLQAARITGNQIRLSSQLSADLYAEVDEALQRLGGKWKGGKTQAHVFDFNPSPLLDKVLQAGVLPAKNPFSYYASTPIVLNEIRYHIGDRLEYCERILEPSVGALGAIAQIVKDAGRQDALTCIEYDPVNAVKVEARGFAVIQDDFLQWQDGVFELILMNPPFNTPGLKNCYVEHLYHAWNMLDVGGRLICVVPMNWLDADTSKLTAFREFIFFYGSYHRLPKDAFKSVGVTVETAVIVIDKPTAGDERRFAQSHEGYCNVFCADLCITLASDSELHTLLWAATEKTPELIEAVNAKVLATIAEQRELGDHLRLSAADIAYVVDTMIEDVMSEKELATVHDAPEPVGQMALFA